MSDSGPLSVSGGVFRDLRVSPEHLRLRQMGLVNTCLGSPGWSNVFSGPRGYLRRSSQDPGLYQMGFVFFSFSWHPGAASGLWVA